MINVLFIVDGLRGGGKERQLVEIIKGLPKEKYRIGVITFNKDVHYSKLVKNSVAYFLELRKRPTRLEPVLSVWKPIRRFKPDIIHTWDMLSSFYAYLPSKILKIKLVDGSVRDAGIERGIEFWLKSTLLAGSSLNISNSLAGLKYYNTTGEVLYNAINPTRFSKKLTSNQFNIIMVANFSDYKDHQTFINAAIILVKNNVVDNVYFAGEGPNRSRFEQWVNNLGNSIAARFHFLGAIRNVEEYLAKCRVGVLCSTSRYNEGVSNSVLEYMAAGLVPIATNVGGTPEIIKHNFNGFLVNEKDDKAIVEIVTTVKNDNKLSEYIVSNARNTILNKFSYKTNLKKLDNIYTRLCAGN